MKKLLSLIFILFILIGCTTETKLNPPANLRFESGNILFDTVTHASSYVLEINDIEYPVTVTTYAITTYGVYEVRVKAIASDGYLDSDFSEILTIDYQRPPTPAPTNFKLEGSIVTWDNMGEGVLYQVVINNHISYVSEDRLVNILDYFTTPFEIKVRAVYTHGLSEYTESIVIESDETYLSSHTIQFDKSSTKDLGLYDHLRQGFGEILKIEKDDSLMNIVGTMLTQYNYIKASYLSTLSVGTNTFYLTTAAGIHKLEIIIKDNGLPYLASTSERYISSPSNVEFIFELFDGTLTSIQGNNITPNDYGMDNHGNLSIYVSYIETMFADETRNTLVLSYTLQKDNQFIIGYLFIHRFQTE